jgi:hypothetical protein
VGQHLLAGRALVQLGLEGTWRRTQYLLPTDVLLTNDGFGMLMTTSFRH